MGSQRPAQVPGLLRPAGRARDGLRKQIRSAYRKQVRQYHPDVNPGSKEAEERFKKINEAYEVLSDPDKRKKYDQLGARWKEYESWQRAQAAAGAQGQPFDWGDSAAQGAPGGARYEYRTVSPEDLQDLFGDEEPSSDFFQTFFEPGAERAAGRRAPRPRRGEDFEYAVEVSLEEAYRGATRSLDLQSASGQTRRLEVKIPPGVGDGTHVRIAGQGGPGRAGGPAGDLYLVTIVRPDPRSSGRETTSARTWRPHWLEAGLPTEPKRTERGRTVTDICPDCGQPMAAHVEGGTPPEPREWAEEHP